MHLTKPHIHRDINRCNTNPCPDWVSDDTKPCKRSARAICQPRSRMQLPITLLWQHPRVHPASPFISLRTKGMPQSITPRHPSVPASSVRHSRFTLRLASGGTSTLQSRASRLQSATRRDSIRTKKTPPSQEMQLLLSSLLSLSSLLLLLSLVVVVVVVVVVAIRAPPKRRFWRGCTEIHDGRRSLLMVRSISSSSSSTTTTTTTTTTPTTSISTSISTSVSISIIISISISIWWSAERLQHRRQLET